MSIASLIDFWKADATLERGLYIHEMDRQVVNQWVENGALSPPDPREPLFERENALHLQLQPMPYVGCLGEADIFLAMINPTVGPPDYVDAQCPEFRQLRSDNLEQRVPDCFALNEDSAAQSWHTYYRRIFQSFVDEEADVTLAPGSTPAQRTEQEISLWEELRQRTAILELFPYYSRRATAILRANTQISLPSAIRSREALQSIAERPKQDALILCRWPNGAQRWGVPLTRCTVSNTMQGLSSEAKAALRTFRREKP